MQNPEVMIRALGGDLPPLRLPERVVPVSQTSPELQRIMASPAARTGPLPTTNEGFLKLSGEPVDQEREIQELLSEFAVSIEPMTVGGVACFRLSPLRVARPDTERLLVNFHGGGFVLGAGIGGTKEALLTAAYTGVPCLSVDYRMPPDFPYPAAIDDGVSVWSNLVAKWPSRTLAMSGSSAGGAIVLALVQRLIQLEMPLPAALVAGTPWSDLSKTGDSYYINDFGYNSYDDGLKPLAEMYAGKLDLRDPRVSPIYGSFEGFPPTLLLTATRDLFLSNTVRVDQKLRDAAVPSRLIVFEGQGHATYLHGRFPEGVAAFREITRFLSGHLGE